MSSAADELPDAGGDPGLALIAYCVNPCLNMPLVAASADRAWMTATDRHFANRCLPLRIANQSGWFLLSGHRVRVTWTGADDLDGLRVEMLDGAPPCPAISHFGYGILTWNVPYLFRTPPGYNLLVRGPANWPKDGVCPLEGVVETDWSLATFTVNWKLTRPVHRVTFDVGEPIAMLTPQRRGELEAIRPEVRAIESAPEIRRGYEQWADERATFNDQLLQAGSEAQRQGWQKHYFQGVLPAAGEAAAEHQTKLRLREFAPAAPGTPREPSI